MKISELLAEMPGNHDLQVMQDDDDETVLVDPKTNVKTVVPKDPNKPGIIQKNDRGQLELNTKTTGTVDRGIKPGDKVSVKPQ